MRSKILESYNASIDATVSAFGGLFRSVSQVWTDDQNQSQVNYDISKKCLDKLEALANERVGHAPARVLDPVRGRTAFQFREIDHRLRGELKYDDRDVVESDKSSVQFIPVAILKDIGSDKFLVAQKSRESAGKDSPEHRKVLLYFGGHIREEDCIVEDSAPKPIDVFRQCLYREVKEELGLDVITDNSDPLCIWIEDGTTSQQHVAVCFLIERDFEHTKLTIDPREFVKLTKKDRFGTGNTIDVEGIIENFERIDSWSQHFLKVRFQDLYEQAARGVKQGSFALTK